MNLPLRFRRTSGFSLVELVIVIVIISIISAVAVPRMGRAGKGADISALAHDLAVISSPIPAKPTNPAPRS